MDTPPLFTDERRHTVRLVWVAVIIAVSAVVIGGIVNYIQRRHPSTQVANQIPPTATPLSYHDFIGTVRATSDTALTVDVVIVDQRGRKETRRYQVTANSDTTVQLSTDAGLSDLAFNHIAIGDRVQAAADQDLAGLRQFTATKIFKLNNS